jgi:nucleoside-diphosphate-sugar epimerase
LTFNLYHSEFLWWLRGVQALPGGSERLKLFTADLMKPGSFDEAFSGCEYVVHCASPYTTDCPKRLAKEKIIKPAIQGTENVISESSSPLRAFDMS